MSTVFKVSQLPPVPLPLQENVDYVLISRPSVGETYKATLGTLANAVGEFIGISSDSAIFASLTPSDGQVLTYDGVNKKWTAQTPTGGTGGNGGDITMTGDVLFNSATGSTNATVQKLKGIRLDFTNELGLFFANRLIGATSQNPKSVYGLNSKDLSEGDMLYYVINDELGYGGFVPQSMEGYVLDMKNGTSFPILTGGYQWLPSAPGGLLVKWGVVSITVGSSLPDVTTINIPTAAPDKLGPSYTSPPFAVYTTVQSSASAICVVDDVQAGKFDLRIWASAGTYKVSWLTFGI